MQLRVGLHLDGQRGEAVLPALDEQTTGPLGLLNVLETQLGLLRQEPSASDRVVQYRAALQRLDGPARFYHRSFAVDELGTAASLLAWRDQWRLHGWDDGSQAALAAAPSRRLRDMAAVEAEVKDKLPPGLGERLRQVALAMQALAPRIERLQLCEPLAHWPLAWQRVLARLNPVESSNDVVPEPGDSMLADLQHAVRAPVGGAHRLRWQDDGSVRVLQAETGWLAARHLAPWIDAEPMDTLLCAPDVGVLDEVLAAAALARQGFKESSAFRPALQVLPLVLGQLWQPLDLFGLLQFLTHPICPVPRVARARLAEMLARSPGIGHGPAWERTLAEIEAASQTSGADWPQVRERIRLWVEHERHDPVQGVPLVVLTERLQTLAQHFQGRLRDADAARQGAFNNGLSQILTLQRALRALALQGESRIAAQPLQTLLAQATAQGSPNPLIAAQAGACRTITHPAAAIDAAQQVLWWQLQAPGDPTPWPWSRAEMAALGQAGIALPDMDDLLAREAQGWLRPLLAARQRLVLVLPPPGAEVHPVWLLLQSLFEPGHAPRVEALEAGLRDERLPALPHQPLPQRRRWWQLPAGAQILARQTESFSSLESLLFNPFQWVLRYPAALSPSSVLDVSDGILLYGNLSHHLVERYVQQPSALTQSDEVFKAWFAAAFDELVAQEGAVLRMPGRQEDLAALRRRLRFALARLRSQWRSAQVVSVVAEEKLQGHFTGGEITGFSDLLVTRQDGEQAIIDMKWGAKSYADKLAGNRHLQLAIYGELLRQKTGRWPRLAYFSLSTGELLAADRDFFPEARVVRQQAEVQDEGAAHLWQRFLVSWRWRRQQLDDGRVEVVLNDDPDEQPPEDGLRPEVLNPAYNDYLTLAGWGDEQ
ncbi:PD-(D/E)XK nuclease family protein [Comamonas badia]|uniref:PD-(D/E)XK nuclease family protein n=1 Tax=Comamonas badia TaxID=265291 RepID=UPI0003F91A55|nr:PD-(D/E)XK nuclease family protein [Comamonas badia]